MSINQYSSPETTLWWPQQQEEQQQHQAATTMEPIQNPVLSAIPIRSWHPNQHHQQPTTWLNSHHPSSSSTLRFNGGDQAQPPLHDNNQHRQQQQVVGEDMRELMFEKMLTPSDVGKLNRLVIPKSHAEAHFPVGADGYSADGKGLLLNFEDQSGKCWRFRYSYWNSSQSYVLTKGWSRYVKENQLDAGDVVLFEKHRLDPNRFFVRWRRRPPGAAAPGRGRRRRGERGSGSGSGNGDGNNSSSYSHGNSESVGCAVSVGWSRGYYPALAYPAQLQQHLSYNSEFPLHAGHSLSSLLSYTSSS